VQNATRAVGDGRSKLTIMDGVALTDFAREQSVALTRFAYLVCGDRGRAEDLVQDAFVAMYRRFGDWLPVAAPVAYARRAIVNGHISHGRRRDTGGLVLVDPPEQLVDPPDFADQDAMWQALATLPGRQRTVLVLRYYLGLPDDEIATTLGCRTGTVRSLASRAFAALRHHPALSASEEAR
jgi:RNA polymerase sigma-70 factor (sigma-E family)